MHIGASMEPTPDEDDIAAALRGMGLVGLREAVRLTPLAGGVSCDVYLAEWDGRRAVAKRALPKLRVEADWRAPAERAEAEVAWIELVAALEPSWVPKVLGQDRGRHLFAMEYLDYPVWKARLAAGRVDPLFAAEVGRALARIHAASAGRADLIRAFANDAQFHALRIEPYLLYTAAANPDVGDAIRTMADGVAKARIALMHGDVSPKNILCGAAAPVFLDAECACYGDPAFDLAFCLNHLLLKVAWHPADANALSTSFRALKNAYLAGAAWEPRVAFERRAAGLLAALLLARVDGKSPVEYLTEKASKDFVRDQAKALLTAPPSTLDELSARYFAPAISR
jgi:aminoglycoside phosphotransferase (APT) family kinase protein